MRGSYLSYLCATFFYFFWCALGMITFIHTLGMITLRHVIAVGRAKQPLLSYGFALGFSRFSRRLVPHTHIGTHTIGSFPALRRPSGRHAPRPVRRLPGRAWPAACWPSSSPMAEALEHMADAAAVLIHEERNAAGKYDNVEGGALPEQNAAAPDAAGDEQMASPSPPLRRLCLCRGNCQGRQRHEPGECGKRSVSDRPLCSSCKAHKGSSIEKPLRLGAEGVAAEGEIYAAGVGAEGSAAGLPLPANEEQVLQQQDEGVVAEGVPVGEGTPCPY